ncbi:MULTISPECIES: hypothetical protein [Alteromonadales]|uniref:Uncharacterized protein n=1 Tax=Catenovulum adriaticum TaxID=2984846 RepID=A0ABY7ARG4_9ALTE|nr:MULTISPECIES: hypothetical protein [Alteromonadales]MBB1396938.1 hypothetical protein [Pseudoalteromonas sp. SG44-8]WAJ72142.1 hypothetical protein OLW01_17835 [Catenovulum sp. TS8]
MKIFVFFIIMFSDFVIADDCSFANVSNEYVIENAEIDAKYSFESKGVSFIAVANGFGPTRPGFEHINMSACLMIKTKWDILWVGADSGVCPQQKKLELHAISYSRLFNEKMIQLAKLSKKYDCATEL